MNRIPQTFERLKAAKQKAFIPYITAGVPGEEETVELALALEGLGADILELGLSFSDPMADGVVNQMASNRALDLGMNTEAYFRIAERIRKRSSLPLIVFSYLNPVYKYGIDRFVKEAKARGMDGILLVDMPVEESAGLLEACRREDFCCIFLVAPTTTPSRLEQVLRHGSGFLYYVSRTGITGVQSGFQNAFEEKLGKVKQASTLPVVVGFGIGTPEQVRTVCSLADGVVVGSALVKLTLEKTSFPEMLAKVKALAGPLIQPTKEIWS